MRLALAILLMGLFLASAAITVSEGIELWRVYVAQNNVSVDLLYSFILKIGGTVIAFLLFKLVRGK